VVADPHDTAHPLPFGELLVQEGLVRRQDVDQAVARQAEEARRGVFLRLGELLVSMNLLDEERVADVLERQGLQILFCPQCLAQYNVMGTRRPEAYLCRRCTRPLERPQKLEGVSVEDTYGPEELIASGEEERVFGPYVILGQISRGGMGIIYRARQTSLDRVVAMKVLAVAGETEQTRFAREARAVAKLRHPYIVAIHEVGRVGGVDYFTMDYIEGLQLNQAIASDGLNPRELVEVFVKVCDAVEYAHGEGLLHRDLKPSNILVDRKRSPVLIDFGIAKATDSLEDSNVDEIIGSPAYLPPEYIIGDAPYDKVGEIYALGATLYTALTGQPPHTGIDTVHVLKAAKREPPAPIRSINRSIDRDLAMIVMTALARQREARYQTVRDLGNDLRRWLEGEEIAGRRSALSRMWSRVRGRVAAAVGLAISGVLLVVSTTYAITVQQLEASAADRVEQIERQRDSLRRSLIETELVLCELLIEADKPDEAERRLTGVLSSELAGPYRPRIHTLRAAAREALGDDEGAALDRRAADRLGG